MSAFLLMEAFVVGGSLTRRFAAAAAVLPTLRSIMCGHSACTSSPCKSTLIIKFGIVIKLVSMKSASAIPRFPMNVMK
jgi:hypothetical protein